MQSHPIFLKLLQAKIDKAFAPKPKLTISQWADKHGILTSGADIGQWRTRGYQIAMMDCFGHPLVSEITLFKSARLGWTEILKHVIGFHVEQEPCSILAVQPTLDDAEAWSKEQIAPFFDECEPLRGLVADSKTRDSDNTIRQKKYPFGTLFIVGANSARGFRRISARIVLFDETDGYPVQGAGQEGDQLKLGAKRADTYWNKKIAYGSTPTDKGISRIEAKAEQSSLGYCFLRCPHCEDQHIRKFREPEEPISIQGEDAKISVIQWMEDDYREAIWVCPSCGSTIEHKHTRKMIDECEWWSDDWHWTKDGGFDFYDTFEGHIGFSIWAGYSLSPNATPQQIVKEFLESKEDPQMLKTFVNTVLGETWQDSESTANPSALEKKAFDYAEWCPQGVLVLTAGVDIQQDRIECSIYGWGIGEECWNIDHLVLFGDTTQHEVWIELAEALAINYGCEDGTELPISSVAVDSGYRATNTYWFCSQVGSNRVFPVKGMAGPGRPVIEDRKKRALRLRKRQKKEFIPEILGTDEIKSALYRRFRVPSGPKSFHFPIERDEEFYKQLVAEVLEVKYVRGVAKRTWVQTRPRNEALDCLVYAFAAMKLLNPDFLTLQKKREKKLDKTP